MSYGAEILADYAYEIDQARREDICGRCKWHKYDGFGRAWACVNDRSDYVADFTDYTDTCECFEQTIEVSEREKALRLLLDWAVECGFGYDNIPEEYEKYEHEIKDMDYTEGLIYIAEREAKKQ